MFEANNTAYYVMEYLGGTTLRDYVETNGAMSPVAAKALLRPVVEAVAMLHHNKIAHYDIKPGNIMLHEQESGEVRSVLIDFGLSSTTTTVDTPRRPSRRRVTLPVMRLSSNMPGLRNLRLSVMSTPLPPRSISA